MKKRILNKKLIKIMIKSSKTSIVCSRNNFQKEEEGDKKENRLTKKLAKLIKVTSSIADDLKNLRLVMKST